MKEMTELGKSGFFFNASSIRARMGICPSVHPPQPGGRGRWAWPCGCRGQAVRVPPPPQLGATPEALLHVRVDLSPIMALQLLKQSLPTATGNDWKFWTVNFRNRIMNVHCFILWIFIFFSFHMHAYRLLICLVGSAFFFFARDRIIYFSNYFLVFKCMSTWEFLDGKWWNVFSQITMSLNSASIIKRGNFLLKPVSYVRTESEVCEILKSS